MKWVIVAIIAILSGGLYYFWYLPSRTVEKNEPTPEAAVSSVPTAETPSVMAREGEIVATPNHAASGKVRLIGADGKKYLRYEDFQTINGPDLFVYLSNDLEAKDAVNIAPLKATAGSVNYEIPTEVNPDNYRYALIWCRAFSVLFNSAELQ